MKAEREAALATLWSKNLDWRNPENHSDDWGARFLDAIRQLQLDALAAAVAALPVEDPRHATATAALDGIVSDVGDLVDDVGDIVTGLEGDVAGDSVAAALTALAALATAIGAVSTAIAAVSTTLADEEALDAEDLAELVDA